MNKLTLEEAAKRVAYPNGEERNGVSEIIYRVFKEGAEWQRNHVWRNVLQSPSDGEMVIAMLEVGPLVCGPNHNDWKQTVDELGIIAWAYFKDLMPTSFDEIIEANKDVLQRLKKGKTK